MDNAGIKLALENGLDLRKLCTTGSVLHINEDYNEDCSTEKDDQVPIKNDFIGEPIDSFEALDVQLQPLDKYGLVKKKILEEGGGCPLEEEFTVSVAYTGYWEGESEPFDYTKYHKPQVVNLKENGLLPGLQTAIKSMLVGEIAVFLLSYKVMYGELGIPPRIKPKADCVFYIKLIRSIITPEDGESNPSESSIFNKIHRDVKRLYASGVTLHKFKNYVAAAQAFRKGVNMLHRCRLADEAEEAIQEKLLTKLYLNLAICYNDMKSPLKACTACNELNRLNNLWNNAKALYQNAKALRMIGQFKDAEKRLRRALRLCPNDEKLNAELEIIEKSNRSCDLMKLIDNKHVSEPTERFKGEVDNLIKSFKENEDLYKLTLPSDLNEAEMNYVKAACDREGLVCSHIQNKYLLDKEEETVPLESRIFD